MSGSTAQLAAAEHAVEWMHAINWTGAGEVNSHPYYRQRCALEEQAMNRDEAPLSLVYDPLICQAHVHVQSDCCIQLIHFSIPLTYCACEWTATIIIIFFTITIAWNLDVTIICHYCLAHPHPLPLFPLFKCINTCRLCTIIFTLMRTRGIHEVWGASGCVHIKRWTQVPHQNRECEVVIASSQTLLRKKATGEKGPATELERGTNTLSRSFSHTSYRSQSKSFVSHRLMYVAVVGVPLYSDRLKTYALRLIQCVMVMVSAGDSMKWGSASLWWTVLAVSFSPCLFRFFVSR